MGGGYGGPMVRTMASSVSCHCTSWRALSLTVAYHTRGYPLLACVLYCTRERFVYCVLCGRSCLQLTLRFVALALARQVCCVVRYVRVTRVAPVAMVALLAAMVVLLVAMVALLAVMVVLLVAMVALLAAMVVLLVATAAWTAAMEVLLVATVHPGRTVHPLGHP